MKGMTLLWVVCLALGLAVWACDDGGGDGYSWDDDDSSSDSDGDSDSDSDGDTDTDADGDSDGDTDADGDSDGDGDCSEYPAGPYNWFEGDIVPDDTFPGRFGPDGADTGLNMGAAHAACAEVKSLIFAAGAND